MTGLLRKVARAVSGLAPDPVGYQPYPSSADRRLKSPPRMPVVVPRRQSFSDPASRVVDSQGIGRLLAALSLLGRESTEERRIAVEAAYVIGVLSGRDQGHDCRLVDGSADPAPDL